LEKPEVITGNEAGKTALQSFANKLRELRKRAGLTQQEFAEAAFCSPDHITKMERGVRLPSSHMLRLMLQTFKEHGIEQGSLATLEQLLLACKLPEPVAVGHGYGKAVATPTPAAAGAAGQPGGQPAGSDDEDEWDITIQTHIMPLRAAQLDVKNNPDMGRFSRGPVSQAMFGRQKELDDLVRALQGHESYKAPLAVITGIGGIGKSTLAYEAASQAVKRGYYEAFIWESAKTRQFNHGEIEAIEFPSPWSHFSSTLTFEGLLDSLIFDLGRDDLLENSASLETKIGTIIQELPKKRYLLVLDNLESAHNPRLVMVYLTQMMQQTNTALLITSREVPSYFDGYNITLRGLDPGSSVNFLQHEGQVRNIPPLRDNLKDPEVAEAVGQIISETGGHPLALGLVTRQLTTFSLDRVLEDLRTGYNEIASLRHRPAGGLYSYLFRTTWENLTRPAQRLLLRLVPAQGKYLTEAEITAQAGIAPEERVRYDLALAELVKYSMLEVTGEFQKRYRLHPLTLNFLKTGLIEHWQKAQK
jgi:DNA-binding XRE family transcriptional regulator